MARSTEQPGVKLHMLEACEEETKSKSGLIPWQTYSCSVKTERKSQCLVVYSLSLRCLLICYLILLQEGEEWKSNGKSSMGQKGLNFHLFLTASRCKGRNATLVLAGSFTVVQKLQPVLKLLPLFICENRVFC